MATEESINPHRHRLAIRSTAFPMSAYGGALIYANDDYWQCLDCGKEWHPDRGGPYPSNDDYRGPDVPQELQHAITMVDRARMAAAKLCADFGVRQ